MNSVGLDAKPSAAPICSAAPQARSLAALCPAFALAQGLGQWLGGAGWLAVALPQRDLFVLATVALPAVALAGAGEGWRGWLRPLWPLAVLVGVAAEVLDLEEVEGTHRGCR